MQTYTLTRVLYSGRQTEGYIIVGESQFYTLERPWLDNKPFVSCIPLGTYLVKRDTTGKHQYYRLQNVPNRSLIEIHAANMCEQLEGCIALGYGFSGGCLVDSKKACDKFLELVGNEDFYLEIIGADNG